MFRNSFNSLLSKPTSCPRPATLLSKQTYANVATILANNNIKFGYRKYSVNVDSEKNSGVNNLQADSSEKFVTPTNVINAKIDDFYVSERAVKRLQAIYKESQQSLKISIESGGCHGFQYSLKLIPHEEMRLAFQNADQIQEDQKETSKMDNAKNIIEDDLDDEDFDESDQNDGSDGDQLNKSVIFTLPNDANILMDDKTLKILRKTYLTYTTELIGSTFKIKGGSMKSSCGCGSSFDIET